MPGHHLMRLGPMLHHERLGLLLGHPGLLILFLAMAVMVWLLLAWAAGRIAAERGHAFGLWFLASVVLGPLGLLAALLAPYTPERLVRASQPAASPPAGDPPA